MKKILGIVTVLLALGFIAAAPFSHWIQFQAQDKYYKILDSSSNPVFSWQQSTKAAKSFGSFTADGPIYANSSINATGAINMTGTVANINLGSNYLSGDGDDEGLRVYGNGNVFVEDLLLLTPKEIAKLVASDPGPTDYFGVSVSVNDSGLLVVGASYWDGAYTDQGCVYTYQWDGTWNQVGSVLTASDAGAADRFGAAVSVNDSGLLVVGATYWDGAYTDQGVVYTYQWDGGWTQLGSVLTASDAVASDRFGAAVSINNTGLLVLGRYFFDGTYADQGGVYTYQWDGTTWDQIGSVLTASDAGASDIFGISVSVNDAGMLVVGAVAWDGAASNQGGVYTYQLDGTTWNQVGSVLSASDAGAEDRFGISVSVNDAGMLVVGSYLWDGAYQDQGGVYTYQQNGTTWDQIGSVLTASDAGASDIFGISVSVNDAGMLIVGSHVWDGQYVDQGHVYTYATQPNATAKGFYNNGNGFVQSSTSELSATVDGAARFVITATNVVASGQIRGTSIYASTGMQSPYFTIASLSRIKDGITDLDDKPVTEFVKQPVPVLRKYELKNPYPAPKIEQFETYSVQPEAKIEESKIDKLYQKEPTQEEKSGVVVTAEEQFEKAYAEWKRIDDSPLYSRKRIGFIVEELPDDFVSDDGTGWDIQAFIAYLYAKTEKLEERIKKLEAR